MIRVWIVVACAWVLGRGAWAAPDAGALREHAEGCEAFGFAGAVLVIDGGEVVLLEGFGEAAPGRGATVDTLFEVASVAKQFTAAAVLRLQDQGRLTLDDAIGEHLPGVPDEHRGVTIRHLLTHTAGWARMGPTGGGPDRDAAVAAYLRAPRVREPGVRMEYHNGGYALLAAIVEHASGRRFEDYLRDEVFAPAGMASTGFCGEAFGADRLAIGHADGRPAGPANAHSFGWEYKGMGGVVTSARDLAAWHAALRDGTVLSDAATEALFTPGLGDYACGWFVHTTDERYTFAPPGLTWQHHGGAVAGFEAELWRFPGRDACIAVLTNRPTDRREAYAMAYDLTGQLLVGHTAFGAVPETEPIDDALAARVAGVYDLGGGQLVELVREGDAMLALARSPRAHALLVRLDFSGGFAADGEAVAAALEIQNAVAAGDTSPIRERMRDGIPASWPSTIGAIVWPAQVERLGALVRADPVAVAPLGPDATRVVLRREHERGEAYTRMEFSAGRLAILDFEHELGGGDAVRYRAGGPGRLETYRFFSSRQGPAIEFDASGEGPAGRVEFVLGADRAAAERVGP